MNNIFFQERSKQILLSLVGTNKQHISRIASDIGGTYAHTFNLLKDMESWGIVKSAKKGRTRYITLTEKGKKLSNLLQDFLIVLKSKGGKYVGKTPTNKKLQKYAASLGSILEIIKSKKLGSKQAAKYSRLAGRFKALNSRLRPKDKTGKKMKREVASLLREIELVLKAQKV